MAKIFSLDIETTGLNIETCQILEFGAIVFDTNNPKSFEDSPKFQRYIKHYQITGEPYALWLNQRILKYLSEKENTAIYESQLATDFLKFVLENNDGDNHITVAGKNVATFDIPFLKKIKGFGEQIKIRHRVVDPAILFFDPINDPALPSGELCKKRAGIDGVIAHTALEDSWDVILMLMERWNLRIKE